MSTKTKAPGPGHPLRSLKNYQSDPAQMLLDLTDEYGPIVRMRLGPYLVHLVSGPAEVRHILLENDSNYERGKFYENFKLFFGDGLLTTDGDLWKSHRAVMQPMFMKRIVRTTAEGVIDQTNDLLEYWDTKATSGGTIELVDEMMELVLGALSRSLFRMNLSSLSTEIGEVVDYGIETMLVRGNASEMLPQWVPTNRSKTIRRYQEVLRNATERVRKEHGTLDGTVDIVQQVLDLDDPWTDSELDDEIRTIFLAGHETTATAMVWALYLLATHEDSRRELLDELNTVLDGREPTVEDLPNMPFTRMVVEETLRLYPPIWHYPRDAINDDEVGSYHVPGGSGIIISPYASQRNPQWWPSPEVFDPHRFDPGKAKERPKFAWYPFGGGPRQCIGIHMAMMEMQLMVAMIVQRFRLEPIDDEPVEYGALQISLRPTQKLNMRVSARHMTSALR